MHDKNLLSTSNNPGNVVLKSPLKYLMAGLLLLTLIACAIGYLWISSARKEALLHAHQNSQMQAETIQHSIGAVFRKAEILVTHVADEIRHEFTTTGGMEDSILASFIERQFKLMPELSSLLYVDAHGKIIMGSGKLPDKPVSVADSDYFVSLRDRGDAGMLVTKPIASRCTPQMVIACCRRITLQDGSFGGIAIAEIAVEHFVNILKKVPVGENGSVALHGENMSLIAGYSGFYADIYNEKTGSETISATWQKMLAEGKSLEGTYSTKSVVDGVNRIFSYRRITPYSLYVNVGIASDDALGESRRDAYQFATALALFFSVSFGIVLGVNRNIRKKAAADKEQKRNLERLKLMQEVSQYHAANIQDLLDFALDKVIALSESSIGYIYHYDEGNRMFTLNSWSRDVMAECEVAEPQKVSHLEKTGLWGDVVRQRMPVMINDFDAPNPHKKGYPDGHVHLYRFLSLPVFHNDRIVAVVGVGNKQEPYDDSDLSQLALMMEGVWNIVERLLLEERIRKAGYEWQQTFDAISDSVCLIDAEQRVSRCNRATSDFLNLSFNEIIGKRCWELFHGSDAPVADCPMLRAKESLKTESSIIKVAGLWLDVTVNPIISHDNEFTAAVHIVRDVTERMKLLEELQEVNELFMLFMKNSPIYTFIKEVTASESIMLEASDNFYDLLGIPVENIVGKNMSQIFPADFADKITADDMMVVESGQVKILEEELNGGSYIAYKFPIIRPGGKRLLAGYTIDITDRKRMEEELVSSKRFLKSTMNSLNAQICILDCEGTIVAVNLPWKSFAEQNGANPASVSVGSNYLQVCKSVRGEEYGAALECYNAIRNLLADSGATDYQFEYPCHSPAEKRWFVCRITSFVHNNKKYLVLAHENITERKKAEEINRELQTQMLQNDKLATIGQLAAGVAHEINNPMAFIASNMITMGKYVEKYNRYIGALEEVLKDKTSGVLPEEVTKLFNSMKLAYVMQDIYKLLEESVTGVDHIKQIVADLKTYARPDSMKIALADINANIESTLNIVNNEIKYFAEINKEYDPDLPRIECNIQQLNQVFLNLLVNASHAVQEKGEEIGKIVIRTSHDAENVMIAISDTGCGIPEEQLGRVFDAFYTTKEVGKGTGLGLSVSAGIVRKHGGEITVSSQVGVGTTFTVILPIIKRKQA